jgi:hypothetical protein
MVPTLSGGELMILKKLLSRIFLFW